MKLSREKKNPSKIISDYERNHIFHFWSANDEEQCKCFPQPQETARLPQDWPCSGCPTRLALPSLASCAYSSVQFSSVQDGIYALRKAHMRSTPSLRSFPSLALETVPMLVWLMRNGMCMVWKAHIYRVNDGSRIIRTLICAVVIAYSQSKIKRWSIYDCRACWVCVWHSWTELGTEGRARTAEHAGFVCGIAEQSWALKAELYDCRTCWVCVWHSWTELGIAIEGRVIWLQSMMALCLTWLNRAGHCHWRQNYMSAEYAGFVCDIAEQI